MKLYVAINSVHVIFLTSHKYHLAPQKSRALKIFWQIFCNINDVSYHNGCITEDLVKHDNEVQHYIAATSSK